MSAPSSLANIVIAENWVNAWHPEKQQNDSNIWFLVWRITKLRQSSICDKTRGDQH